MACLFGHKWDGCKCTKCGKTRDEGHDWDLCKGKCKRCGKACGVQHDWDGCKCTRCGKTRDEGHSWDGCKCMKCGKTRDEGHNYQAVDGKCVEKCSVCGKTRDISHKWDGCKCTECGKTRHDWNGCKCKTCGETRDEEHDFQTIAGKRFKKCKVCGVIIKYDVMDDCLNRLLAIFPLTPLTSQEHKRFNEMHMDEVRAIGEELDKLGGMSCMRQVGEKFARALPIHARKLETMWDGIGYWMG